MLKNISRRFGFIALTTGAATQAVAHPAGDMEKVVYHLNQPGGDGHRYYRQVLRNLSNHVSVLPKENYELRVVMHGAGLGLLRTAAKSEPQIAASIDELKLAGVRFEICRITLKLDSIRLEELYDAVEGDLVESGVAQVARLQQKGFSYVKI